MKKNTILITGGAGYIGSHVNKMLRNFGYDTFVLDNFSRGHVSTLQNTPFMQGDISDPALLNKIFTNHSIDTVMHFAALTDVGESVNQPEIYYRNNVSYTLNLLNSMVQHGVKYLIFSSSAAIFGHPQTDRINENHPPLPINPYGNSKLIVEKMLKDFDLAHGLKSCCIRYFNAAGGDPDGKIKFHQNRTNNLIPLILKNLKSGLDNIKIFGTDYPTSDGTCVRDYIHIEDVGTAHILCMEQLWKEQASNCFNLGNGRGYSVKEVIYAVEKITGKKIQVIEAPRRLGDAAVLIADANKAMQELNWNPRYPLLDQMIEHAWKALDYL